MNFVFLLSLVSRLLVKVPFPYLDGNPGWAGSFSSTGSVYFYQSLVSSCGEVKGAASGALLVFQSSHVGYQASWSLTAGVLQLWASFLRPLLVRPASPLELTRWPAQHPRFVLWLHLAVHLSSVLPVHFLMVCILFSLHCPYLFLTSVLLQLGGCPTTQGGCFSQDCLGDLERSRSPRRPECGVRIPQPSAVDQSFALGAFPF